jgi:peptide/nickel transport system substrate-binding protein
MTMAQGDDNETLTSGILKSDLAQLNIDLQVSALQWTAQWNKGKSSDVSGRQDIFVMYWYPDYADAFSWFTQLFHSSAKPYFNLSYAKDPALDKQIDGLQQEAAKGTEQANVAYQAAQKSVVNDALTLTFFVNTYQRPFRSSLTNYVDNPAYANVVFAYDVAPGAGA